MMFKFFHFIFVYFISYFLLCLYKTEVKNIYYTNVICDRYVTIFRYDFIPYKILQKFLNNSIDDYFIKDSTLTTITFMNCNKINIKNNKRKYMLFYNTMNIYNLYSPTKIAELFGNANVAKNNNNTRLCIKYLYSSFDFVLNKKNINNLTCYWNDTHTITLYPHKYKIYTFNEITSDFDYEYSFLLPYFKLIFLNLSNFIFVSLNEKILFFFFILFILKL